MLIRYATHRRIPHDDADAASEAAFRSGEVDRGRRSQPVRVAHVLRFEPRRVARKAPPSVVTRRVAVRAAARNDPERRPPASPGAQGKRRCCPSAGRVALHEGDSSIAGWESPSGHRRRGTRESSEWFSDSAAYGLAVPDSGLMQRSALARTARLDVPELAAANCCRSPAVEVAAGRWIARIWP